ncbi:MAG: adenylate/guanylate cyclase domain-containing protein [Acidobacteriota bacterium]|jgi:adenylate cyclase
MPRLLLKPGRADERAFDLAPGSHTIGRAEDNDVFVLEGSLSRHHARIDVTEEGAVLTDLGSTNGTFVDGKRIESRPLDGSETIRCGGLPFRFVPDRAQTDTESRPTMSRAIDADLTRLSMQDLLDTPFRRPGAAEERLRILLKVSQLLASPAPIDDLLERVLDLALEILDIDRAAILMTDPEDGGLVPRVIKTRDGVSAAGTIYSQHIVNYVRENEVAALFGDAQADPRLAPARSVLHQSICASMCAPLKPRDQVVGVLYVDNLSTPDRFKKNDLDFLSAFANQAAVALENSSLYEKLEREAVVRNNLLRFFPPATIGRMMEGEELSLQTRETEVTALFCDLCGFTELSASMEPREILALLNAYFPVMAEVVFRHEGTLEKYIGDALMAVWGAPFRSDDDAVTALRAAVEMQHAVHELNRRLREAGDGHPELRIHIGLNTGPVAAGNVGSERYIQYATLGTATNLASRICDLAGPHEIYLSEATLERLGDELEWSLRKLGPTEIKGHDDPLRLYAVRWREALDS